MFLQMTCLETLGPTQSPAKPRSVTDDEPAAQDVDEYDINGPRHRDRSIAGENPLTALCNAMYFAMQSRWTVPHA
jgi:hypothetical protein